MSRVAELLQRWQDGSVSEPEFAELKDILRTKAGRLELVREFQTVAAITEEFRKGAEVCECGLRDAEPRPTVAAIGGPGKSPRPSRLHWLLPGWLFAWPRLGLGVVILTLSCLAGAAYVYRGEPSRAKVARVDGEVILMQAGKSRRAEAGQILQVGDEVRSPLGAKAIIQYENESTFFTVLEDSDVKLVSHGGGKHLELMRGNMEADVAPQPRFQPMVVMTPHAKTTMLGTRFLLRATPETTRLKVIQGLVRVNRHDEHGSIDVSTGHSAEAAPHLELKAVALDVITVNFGPPGMELPAGVLNDSGEEFRQSRGYGWEGPKHAGVIPGEFIEYKGRFTPAPRGRSAGIRTAQLGRTDGLRASHVQAGWIRHTQSWKMRLAPGRYSVTVCAGDSESPQGPLHVNIQGRQIINGVFTAAREFCEVQDVPIEVNEEGWLRMVVGGYPLHDRMPDGSSDTTLNFIVIKRAKQSDGRP